MSRVVKWVMGIFTGVFIGMMYLPFLSMFTLSFQDPMGGSTFPLKGLSLYFYQRLFDLTPERIKYAEEGTLNIGFTVPLIRSLALAILTLTITVVLGTMAAQGFRKPFKGSGLAFYLFLLGIITPGVSVGLGLALFYRYLGITRSWWGTTLSVHILWTLPFAFLIMLIMFNRFDATVEEAARVLGANEWVTFRTVTLPLMLPGIMSAALFSFTLSFDELARSMFLTGVEQTMPLITLQALSLRITPKLYAWGSVITLFSFMLIISYLFYIARTRQKPRKEVVAEQIPGL
ncbi:MAG: ABC transporter permease [Chloroflexi bacterium]|nr:ABC transporter permease [Chloroflexota bacterium]